MLNGRCRVTCGIQRAVDRQRPGYKSWFKRQIKGQRPVRSANCAMPLNFSYWLATKWLFNNYSSILLAEWLLSPSLVKQFIWKIFKSGQKFSQEIRGERNMRLFEIIQRNPSAIHDNREKKRRSNVSYPTNLNCWLKTPWLQASILFKNWHQ